MPFFLLLPHFFHGYICETPLPQSVRSWSEYLEYDREGKEGDPSLVGGSTSLIRLLLDRMGVLHCDPKDNCNVWIVKTILQDRLTTKTNCEVDQINWAPSGVQITTATGEKYSR